MVKTTVNRRPLSVRPNEKYRASGPECATSPMTTGLFTRTCSASVWLTLCPTQFFEELPSSH